MLMSCCVSQYSVVRIVREKMLRTEAFSDPEQLQVFLSQLYVFLVDEMHVSLNKVRPQKVPKNVHLCYLIREASLMLKVIDLNKTFSIKHWCFMVCIISCVSVSSVNQILSVESQDTHHEPLLSCAQLKHFAKEAQLNSDYQLAAQYYQEVKHFWYFKITHYYCILHSVLIIRILYKTCFTVVYISVKHYYFSFIEIILLSGLCSVFRDFYFVSHCLPVMFPYWAC